MKLILRFSFVTLTLVVMSGCFISKQVLSTTSAQRYLETVVVTPTPASTERLATPSTLTESAGVTVDLGISGVVQGNMAVTASLIVPTATPAPTATPIIEPTPVDPAYTLNVPILMYHYLSDPPMGADAIRLDLSVTPANFEAQLSYLRQAGFETISFEELHFALTWQTELPEKPIILSFDDGHRDAYEYAFPLLQKYDYRATFFVFTQPIDEYNVDFLTWEMIQEMHQAGMEFGSHSYTHPDMRERDVDFLVYQIVGSKEAIEERIGEPVRFFCYPAGRYDQQVIKVLDSAHFWGAVTTQWGDAHSFNNRFEMTRIRMRGSDTVAHLAARVKD